MAGLGLGLGPGPGPGGAAEPRPLLVKIVMAGESCVGKTSIVRRYTEPVSPPAGSAATSYMATIVLGIPVCLTIFCCIPNAPFESGVPTSQCILSLSTAPTSVVENDTGIDFKVKTVMFNDTRVKLQIWDTAGQERFHTLSTSYFRGAQGFVLVYDITNLKSFQSITMWMSDIYEAFIAEVIRWHFEKYVERDMYGSPNGSTAHVMLSKRLRGQSVPNKWFFNIIKGDEVDVILLGNKCDKESERVVPKEKGEKLAWEYGMPFFETSAKENVNIEHAFSVLTKEILEKKSCVLHDLDVVSLNETKKRTCCAF